MFNARNGSDQGDFESPHITDYGSLMEITQACFGTGGEDGSNKMGNAPFVNSAPYFNDPTDFCQ